MNSVLADQVTDWVHHFPVWEQGAEGVVVVAVAVLLYEVNSRKIGNGALHFLSLVLGFMGFVILFGVL